MIYEEYWLNYVANDPEIPVVGVSRGQQLYIEELIIGVGDSSLLTTLSLVFRADSQIILGPLYFRSGSIVIPNLHLGLPVGKVLVGPTGKVSWKIKYTIRG